MALASLWGDARRNLRFDYKTDPVLMRPRSYWHTALAPNDLGSTATEAFQ
jgi:hypothetical protein